MESFPLILRSSTLIEVANETNDTRQQMGSVGERATAAPAAETDVPKIRFSSQPLSIGCYVANVAFLAFMSLRVRH